MADVKISALTALGAAPAAADQLPIVDTSAGATKKVTIAELFTNPNVTGTVTADGLTVDATTAVIDVLAATNDDATLFLRESGIGVVGAELTYDGGDNKLYLKVGNNSNTKRLSVDRDTGDISFYEDTGTTAKFYWDASAESLGIGTASPDAPLHVNNNNGVRIGSTSSYHLLLKAAQTPVVSVGGSTTAAVITTTGTGGGAGHVGFEIPANDQNDGFYVVTDSNTDGTPDTVALKINALGHSYFGKTAESVATEGIQLMPNGDSAFTRDAGLALYLNRTTSDGSIVEFRKDNTAVGSIGSSSGLYFTLGNSNAGLIFNPTASTTGAVYPWNVSTDSASDGLITLGQATRRFKDLYLSGGVYLGGTGAANLLDDYEEGEYTPTLTPSTSGTVTLNTSFDTLAYTKVGRKVHVQGQINVASVATPVGTTISLSLPFAIANNIAEIGDRFGCSCVSTISSTENLSVISGLAGATTAEITINASTVAALDNFKFSFEYLTNS